jgi:hypothetical protein
MREQKRRREERRREEWRGQERTGQERTRTREDRRGEERRGEDSEKRGQGKTGQERTGLRKTATRPQQDRTSTTRAYTSASSLCDTGSTVSCCSDCSRGITTADNPGWKSRTTVCGTTPRAVSHNASKRDNMSSSCDPVFTTFTADSSTPGTPVMTNSCTTAV